MCEAVQILTGLITGVVCFIVGYYWKRIIQVF